MNTKIDSRLSAFISETDSDSAFHIVDQLIAERCPSFVDHPSWIILKPILYKLLHYKRARKMADEIATLKTGRACFEYLHNQLGLDVRVSGSENIPADGRMIVVCNHPTGLADGPAIWSALSSVRSDLQIYANADACRVNPVFADIIIPVEWVLEKRTPGKARETLRRAGEAFKAEQCQVIFPSGRLAHMINGQLTDKEWFPTAVTLARKNKAPILPVHIEAKNSSFYYLVSKLSNELRDITLFYELLNKQGDRFNVTVGSVLSTSDLDSDPQKATKQLKHHVEHIVPKSREQDH